MRILLCEDEKELSSAISRLLKKFNYEVDAAFDGQEALEYSKASNYDAIILDIMMPKLTGIEVLKEIRKSGNNIPIIMLTAKSEVDDKVLGLDLGANDYLTKPFDSKELLARLRVITRTSVQDVSSLVKVGNVTLNRSNFEISTREMSFKLARKEFQMMEIFMINKSNIISTERFLEKIWGYDSEVDINIVWVYISYLRNKLKMMNANISIKSKRNLGYYLEEE